MIKKKDSEESIWTLILKLESISSLLQETEGVVEKLGLVVSITCPQMLMVRHRVKLILSVLSHSPSCLEVCSNLTKMASFTHYFEIAVFNGVFFVFPVEGDCRLSSIRVSLLMLRNLKGNIFPFSQYTIDCIAGQH